VDEDGFTPEKLAVLMEIKNDHYGRVADYASKLVEVSNSTLGFGLGL